MLLDEYLNYLQENDDEEEEEDREEEDQGKEEDEDDEEEIDEKAAIIRKLKKILTDPMRSKAYLKTRAAHGKRLKKFRRDYTGKVAAAKKLKTPAGRKARYSKIKKGAGLTAAEKKERARLIRNLQKSARQKEKAKKVMKWRKRGRTAVGLSGVGGAGFVAAKRADEKGQSI